ncbi:MAG: DUF177 domain-containing protein [Rhizobiales bacterium]|nr:DUF177 domain-containing protein [Hyphomicrobiales bacterium]
MNKDKPELPRPLPVDRVPRGGSMEEVVAEPAECQDLAGRLDIPALHEARAKLKVSPWRGGGLKVEGEVAADLDQVSVISLEPFRQRVRFPVLRYFLPPGADTGEADADPIVGGEIDLGEIVAETLALELDPYPRRPGESFAVDADTAEARESPFLALRKLVAKPK